MAIFADNRELPRLNHMKHYIRRTINYLHYGLPHTLDTPARDVYMSDRTEICPD